MSASSTVRRDGAPTPYRTHVTRIVRATVVAAAITGGVIAVFPTRALSDHADVIATTSDAAAGNTIAPVAATHEPEIWHADESAKGTRPDASH